MWQDTVGLALLITAAIGADSLIRKYMHNLFYLYNHNYGIMHIDIESYVMLCNCRRFVFNFAHMYMYL